MPKAPLRKSHLKKTLCILVNVLAPSRDNKRIDLHPINCLSVSIPVIDTCSLHKILIFCFI